jgi:hypothetical protein
MEGSDQMANRISTQSARNFVAHVSGQGHAMAGAVIALNAAHAVSLGLACLKIRQGEMKVPDVPRMESLLAELLDWADRDADAIATLATEREAGRELVGQRLLTNAPAQVARLVVEAACILERFRPYVNELVADDLEMSIRLLTGAAQASLLLLDSNLRIWPEPDLLAEFEPLLEQMDAEIRGLSPVARIRE